MQTDARAFWLREPGVGEIRATSLPRPRAQDVTVRTLRSAVSRGTESLVFGGHVPPSQYAAMRAPFQDGDFPGPVKYGYLSVGTVEDGPSELCGRTVFCLHPHQTAYVVPASAVMVVPHDVPVPRAVLAGIVETAVNALWDVPPVLGDRVAVVGAGALGCCVARLLARVPGVSVTLVDVEPDRAPVAAALGARFALPRRGRGRPRPRLPHERDVVRPAAKPGASGAGGHRGGAQLVRRQVDDALPRRQLPLRSAQPPGEPGGQGSSRAPRSP